MKEGGQAAVGDEVGDEELLLLAKQISDERQQIGVLEPAQPPHVLVEVLPRDAVHLFEPLHHQRLPVHQHRLVRRPEVPAAQHLRRRSHQVLQVELLPSLLHKRQLPRLVLIRFLRSPYGAAVDVLTRRHAWGRHCHRWEALVLVLVVVVLFHVGGRRHGHGLPQLWSLVGALAASSDEEEDEDEDENPDHDACDEQSNRGFPRWL